MNPAAPLPRLLPLDAVRRRLEALFPTEFADRGPLVGDTAVRAVFVLIYGGFVEGSGRYLRPSFVYRFTEEQTRRVSEGQRRAWLAQALKPGFRPAGRRWYADNSRESIRDDLFRSRFLDLGVLGRREGVPTTSSRPTHFLKEDFARLFDPSLSEGALDDAMQAWRKRHLSSAALNRMRLRRSHLAASAADVFIDLPDGTRLRVSAGPSSVILKAIIEQFAPRYLRQPAVLWISASDRKTWPQFVETHIPHMLRRNNLQLPALM